MAHPNDLVADVHREDTARPNRHECRRLSCRLRKEIEEGVYEYKLDDGAHRAHRCGTTWADLARPMLALPAQVIEMVYEETFAALFQRAPLPQEAVIH